MTSIRQLALEILFEKMLIDRELLQQVCGYRVALADDVGLWSLEDILEADWNAIEEIIVGSVSNVTIGADEKETKLDNARVFLLLFRICHGQCRGQFLPLLGWHRNFIMDKVAGLRIPGIAKYAAVALGASVSPAGEWSQSFHILKLASSLWEIELRTYHEVALRSAPIPELL